VARGHLVEAEALLDGEDLPEGPVATREHLPFPPAQLVVDAGDQLLGQLRRQRG